MPARNVPGVTAVLPRPAGEMSAMRSRQSWLGMGVTREHPSCPAPCSLSITRFELAVLGGLLGCADVLTKVRRVRQRAGLCRWVAASVAARSGTETGCVAGCLAGQELRWPVSARVGDRSH